MGDDLIFAQKFTRTAADGLAMLAEMPDPRAKTDAPVVINMMTTVQRGAKRLRARNIYVGAQGVLSALHHENDDVLTGRIETLGSLVTEYARGLDELLTSASPATPRTVSDKWDMARETLNALLPKAQPDTADMLSRLMRAPVTLETVNPEFAYDDEDVFTTESEVIPFRKATVESDIEANSTLNSNIDLETNDLIAPELDVAPKTLETVSDASDAPTETLDAMMRDVIADALSVARGVGKTISLSYDMGERSVTSKRAADLRTRLGRALSQIIRQALSEDRVGHIDINLAGEQLHIMAGTTAMRVAINPKTMPTPKPLITQETEQGLREQLDALMDPIHLHDTAS